jgi:D-methionine transport system ATP-binding protein
MIEIQNLSKTYSNSGEPVKALENVSLTINDGEIFGIIGLSGAGKSTLVRCINLLEKPTEGRVLLDGQDLTGLSEKELLKVRRGIGMIFQGFNLLEQRTVLKNVCFPLEIAGEKKEPARARALELLEMVGLKDKADVYPSQLSGGQKQRVAIARALATKPKYLLCDEATSALDPNTTRSILELLKEINENLGVTIVVITHEMRVIDRICDRVAVIDQSRIAEEGLVSEVFANPRSDIAKQLILRQDDAYAAFKKFTGRKLRLVFDGVTSNKPLISEMVLACQAPVSVMSADMRDIDGIAYGYTIIELPDDERLAAKITAWLDASPIKVYEEE